jgi:hypothetical protein
MPRNGQSQADLKSPKKKSTKSTKIKTVTQPKSHRQHCKEIHDDVKKHGNSDKTTKSYDGHLRRAREWVAEYAKEQERLEMSWRTNHPDQDEEGESFSDLSPEFATCLDGAPVKCTPEGIVAFMHNKCFGNGRGKSTASQIHAAFLRYYNSL